MERPTETEVEELEYTIPRAGEETYNRYARAGQYTNIRPEKKSQILRLIYLESHKTLYHKILKIFNWSQQNWIEFKSPPNKINERKRITKR